MDDDDLLVRRVNGVRWTVTPSFFSSPGFAAVSRLGEDWRPRGEDRRAERRQRFSSVFRADGAVVFLKHYLPRSFYERIKYLLRPSRASAEWRNARRLESLGVRVPAPLARGERRGPGGWRRSLLVTEALPAAPTLLEWSRLPRDVDDIRHLRRTLAQGIARMHANGMFHRDLHGDNVLVDESSGVPVPCLLDFHEMVRLPRPIERLCIADLARLNGFVEAGRWQRLRFLREYLDARGIPRARLAEWLVAVDDATRALWDHYEHKGRDYRRYD